MTKDLDQRELKWNQGSIIVLLVLAFVLNSPWLVALVAAVMAVGTIWPEAALFQRLYRGVRARGWVRPRMEEDDPRPHRFAQGLGAGVLIAALASFVAGGASAAWALVWLVVLLAAVNVFLNFCAGCFLYYQLQRRGFWRGA